MLLKGVAKALWQEVEPPRSLRPCSCVVRSGSSSEVVAVQQTVSCAGPGVGSWGSGILSLCILHTSNPPAPSGKLLASAAGVDLL